MKKLMITAIALSVALGASQAQANWKFWENNNNDKPISSATHTTPQPVSYDATANDPEAQKWIYNGSSAYRGGLSGHVAVEDSMRDGDNTAFVVRPVRGANNQFNASLRNGDTGQSDETRINQAFNN